MNVLISIDLHPQHIVMRHILLHMFHFFRPGGNRSIRIVTYLVQVDGGLPELLLGLVEVAHTDLTEVTGVVLVDVGAVVVLTTSHTTTTRALTVLADTTVTGGHVAAAVIEKSC